MTIDLSYEASLVQQYKKTSGRKVTPLETPHLPDWMTWIQDLVEGAGFSYSRIAYRIKVSPSTIQKLATHPERKPRERICIPLKALHAKVFEGPYATPQARAYWAKKK
jgi:hypothetical protein